MPKLDYHMVKRPMRKDAFSWDTGIIRGYDNKIFVGVINVFGQEETAQDVASRCEDFLDKNSENDLIQTIGGLHRHINGTPGAAVGLCRIDNKSMRAEYVCVGNISFRILGSGNIRIIPGDGIVGNDMETPKRETIDLYKKDVLVIHTDGVEGHFGVKEYPGLLTDDSKTAANRIIDQFGKKDTDALCMVLRFQV